VGGILLLQRGVINYIIYCGYGRMYKPERRNKNIGTKKQGHGRNNKLVIPERWREPEKYWEKLNRYVTVKRFIKNKHYFFIIEQTRKNSFYSCTVDDVVQLLHHIPDSDLDGLNIIVFRQPKRKEEILDLVWGRLLYYVEIGEYSGPAIMLESVDLVKRRKFEKSMSVERQKEFKRLIGDGHEFVQGKKYYLFYHTITHCRNTQLYRTFPHEVGHYVEYLNKVEKPDQEGEDFLDLWDAYDRIPSVEKEQYAHTYAEKFLEGLKSRGIIPFDRIVDRDGMINENINPGDFIVSPDSL
jgi:predicted SprT family Zn-dependent metalloprotease